MHVKWTIAKYNTSINDYYATTCIQRLPLCCWGEHIHKWLACNYTNNCVGKRYPTRSNWILVSLLVQPSGAGMDPFCGVISDINTVFLFTHLFCGTALSPLSSPTSSVEQSWVKSITSRAAVQLLCSPEPALILLQISFFRKYLSFQINLSLKLPYKLDANKTSKTKRITSDNTTQITL